MDSTSLAYARSFLFVPGDRSDRFAKAMSSGADMVICDLEDSVRIDRKAFARSELATWLDGGGRASVRINAIDSSEFSADCAALMALSGLRSLIVPKAEDPESIRALHEEFGGMMPIIALIETALGLHRAQEIAEIPGVIRLAFGSIDFALDLHSSEENHVLNFARFGIVMASRIAGIAPPIDGVNRDLDNPEATGKAARMARDLGFGGMLCIHPRQVLPVNTAFMPSSEEIRQAQSILASSADGSAVRFDGQMIDKPVVDRARFNLEQAGLLTPDTQEDRTS
jgi:citrate lyase subunit beta/citryl-CoA lyase